MNQINQSETSKRRLKNLLIFLFSVFFIGVLFFFDKIGEKRNENVDNNIRNESIEKTCNKCGKEYYYTHYCLLSNDRSGQEDLEENSIPDKDFRQKGYNSDGDIQQLKI